MAMVNNKGRSLHAATAGDNVDFDLQVQGFAWTGPTDAAHTMTIKDGNGDIMWGPFTAGIVGQSLVIMFDKPVNAPSGIEVDVLGSGVVDIFLR